MSALEWESAPRPMTGAITVFGPCRCGRRRYYHEGLGHGIRCAGCDEVEWACYCPLVPAQAS